MTLWNRLTVLGRAAVGYDGGVELLVYVDAVYLLDYLHALVIGLAPVARDYAGKLPVVVDNDVHQEAGVDHAGYLEHLFADGVVLEYAAVAVGSISYLTSC